MLSSSKCAYRCCSATTQEYSGEARMKTVDDAKADQGDACLVSFWCEYCRRVSHFGALIKVPLPLHFGCERNIDL